MNDDPQKDDSLTDAFRKLGENLVQTFKAAWDSPERVRLQKEIEDGLVNLTDSVKVEVDKFNQTATGQDLKSDFDDLRERIRTGQAETQVREEILKALKLVNTELEKAANSIRGKTEDNPPPTPPEQG